MDTDTTTVDPEFEARVQRGIEWLQSNEAREAFGPIDLGRIDWDHFDIDNTQECVLGQVIDRGQFFSGYSRVDEWLYDRQDNGRDSAYRWMIDHGFYAAGEPSALEAAWRDALYPAS